MLTHEVFELRDAEVWRSALNPQILWFSKTCKLGAVPCLRARGTITKIQSKLLNSCRSSQSLRVDLSFPGRDDWVAEVSCSAFTSHRSLLVSNCSILITFPSSCTISIFVLQGCRQGLRWRCASSCSGFDGIRVNKSYQALASL